VVADESSRRQPLARVGVAGDGVQRRPQLLPNRCADRAARGDELALGVAGQLTDQPPLVGRGALERLAAPAREQSLLPLAQPPTGLDQLVGLPRVVTAHLIQRPGGHARLAQPLYLGAGIAVSLTPQPAGELVAGGRELVQRQRVEAVDRLLAFLALVGPPRAHP
jgi:hypothetical protein